MVCFAAADGGSAGLAWCLVAILSAFVVFLVGFYGSQKPKPVGLGFGFYPALFLGASGGDGTFFGLVAFFSAMHLL
ncbi:hypothetical protein AQJ43_37770 [Streptomyces avermitilis]|uniref:Uncharacterized protein n=2 Tax=Streptomyces avermitilis TaxID=33903 RepID=A0A143T0N5_STRAW|nr:hypothetical protein [Streptomyces avermitilis]KUN46664.1 hypothetical protein AQJ43_37770 [Streptomyces avermitilis]BAU77594.1 hypothetical protein SAVERM_2p151 [Streptomyces avermitilis MA-4680 = NBRC 14893]GDY70261.1 hypothetical protein SAV14893_096540 [Streptomyces avermitilis]GDY80569.1 hypothetical protein SAV31267_100540 [Streptomyces avermitilis]